MPHVAKLIASLHAATALAAGLTLAVVAAAAPALAQSPQALIGKYRQQCLAQFSNLGGPGQQGVVFAHVHACIEAKMKAAMPAMERDKANAPTPGGQGLTLLEFTPWLDHPRRGPAEAKGVIYFVGGYTLDPMLDDYKLGPYMFKTLSDDGWDIIFAKMPQSERHPPIAIETLGEGARTMERRAKELRAEGYKRVVVGGHSWGAWVALVAARDHVDADAILSSAPTTFGPNISPINHRPNENFRLNLSEFPAAIGKVDMPIVLIIPDDDVWDPDPAARGEMAQKHFAKANVPNILLVKPPGMTSHFTAWWPLFDFAYGKCIETFLEAPKTQVCALPPLSNADFRSILDITQVADADRKRIASAEPLVGKKFDVYIIGEFTRQYDYVSASERTKLIADAFSRERFSFRDGLLCAEGKCTSLIRWSDSELLEFDPKSGDLIAWWIEN